MELHYRGTLVDGFEFDNSKKLDKTIKFQLNRVPKGWQEGISYMKKGGKAIIVVPSELAYGDAGILPDIAPGATLMFELELLDIL